jgi:putative SOS response-associated peptidase YedK
MCGRVSTPDQEFIARKLQLKHADALIKPGGINLPPTVELPVITDDKPKILQYFYWSLIPFWAKEKPKFSSFNARLENLHESGAWRNLLGKRHCIVITDGFFESFFLILRVSLKTNLF